ncbi:FG-GAP-like repeat-containing protein [Hymenobacter rubidus]|uniref:FG-GAP-like repeat-containing protein n=1 Tax=Hymenobacter rubidus TaxID=1441626 RepID=UPI00191EEDD6|nr:FG-GAP-like repeat-containing protein [Hymenobacter rubidus]
MFSLPPLRWPRFLAGLVLLLTLWTGQAQAQSSQASSIGQVLNPDGTLRAGAKGSFSAAGYRMTPDSSTGAPVFRPTGTGDDHWQDGFTVPGTSGYVLAMAVDANGNVYVGGSFSAAGNVSANNIAKWNGTTWSAMGSGIDGFVSALAVDGSGNVYAGGTFTTAGGVAANNVAKWNGSVWIAMGSGTNSNTAGVLALAVSSTGTVYAGGGFTTAGGVSASFVAKWNGTNWSAVGSGTNNVVFALAADSFGGVYVGGNFSAAGGVVVSSVAYLDAFGFWNALGSAGPFGSVRALAVDGSGGVYAGGGFATIGAAGLTVNNVAHYSNGQWSALGTGVNSTVRSLAVDGTGNVYAGGYFTAAGGIPTASITKWSGTAWSAMGPGMNNSVFALVTNASGSVYAGGYFAAAGYVLAGNVAVWNGAAWNGVGSGLSFDAQAIALDGRGNVYVGGVSTNGFTGASNVAKWNGTAWSSLSTGIGIVEIYAMAVDGVNGNLYAAGTGGNVWRWNGTTWSIMGSGMNGTIYALATDSYGGVYVGGSFSSAGSGSILLSNIARWGGTDWIPLGSAGPFGSVRALATDGNGGVYVGGGFASIGAAGLTVNNVAHYSNGQWYPLGTGVNNTVRSVAVDGTGNVYAGGDFTTAGGTLANHVAKWSGSWSAMGSGVDNQVLALAADASGNVYAGGNFTTAGGAAAYNIAKWNGSSWSTPGTGLNSTVNKLAMDGFGNVYAGGAFATVADGSKVSGHFGIYRPVIPPTVSTAGASNITAAGVTLGGNVSSDGGGLVTERGVVYMQGSGTPTTSNSKIVIGSGTGPYAQAITGLNAVTQYTVRAYAINAAGTSYGVTQGFTTLALPLLINSTSPTNGTRAAATASSVLVTFNQAIGAGAVGAFRVFSAQRGGRRTASSGTTTGNANTVRFAPTYAWQPGEIVQATVTTAATSITGRALSLPWVWQFTTAVGSTGAGFFTAPVNNPNPAVGVDPFSVAVGDVDGDGDLDFVTANRSAGTVSVRLNNGTGSFTAPAGNPEAGVGTNPNFVVMSDVDGDGDLDLLTANYLANTVSVRLNDGTGSFTPPATTPEVGVGTAPASLAVGDVDGDGDLDLLTANNTAGTVSVRLNNGTGSFSPSATNPNPAVGAGPFSVAVGDVDGDGDLDLLTANRVSGTVSVRLNNGAGNFTAPTTNPEVGVGVEPFSVAVGDVDGDGDLDLLTANRVSGTVSVRLNNGAGNFTAPTTNPEVGVGSLPLRIAVGDVDGDGDLDFVTANSNSNTVSVRLNNGMGSFTVPGTNPEVSLGTAPASVVLGDIDGDGDLDLLTTGASNANTVSVRLNQPATFPNLVVSTGTLASPTLVAAGTYNALTVTTTGVAQLTGSTVVNSSVSVNGTLLTHCQPLTGAASFTLAAGATLGICDPDGLSVAPGLGAVRTTGARSFSPAASYLYNGTQVQATGTGLPSQVLNLTSTNANALALSQPVAVRQALTLNAGNLNTSGQALTLLSDAIGTALIANLGAGVVSGDVTVQRYLDPSTNPGPGRRLVAAPVSGQTVAAFGSGGTALVFNPAYNTAPNPGAVLPYPSIFRYDQSRLASSPATTLAAFDKGWVTPSGPTDAASPGSTGFAVQVPGGQTLSFTGAVGTGPTALAGSRNSGPTAAEAGWNLVGNPYPSPLDLSTVAASQRVNVDAAVYTFESSSSTGGSYRSYVNGVGTPLIGTGQAFLIRVSSGQTTGALALTNANRVTTYARQAPVRRGSRPQLQLALAGAGLTDTLVVYAEAGATLGWDPDYDAPKLWNPSGLSLAAVTPAGDALAIDGRPAFVGGQVTPLTVQVPQTGSYALTADVTNLPPGVDLTLVDRGSGARTQLLPGTQLTVQLPSGTSATRLQLEAVSTVTSTAATQRAAQVLVFPNPARGYLIVQRPPTATASAELLNALGQVVRRVALPGATTAVELPGLASGVYSLRVWLDGRPVVKRVVVE